MILRNGTLQSKIFRRYASSSVNHYEVLGLSPNASLKDIKKKYRELSKRYHPDLNTDDKEQNNESFIKITKSYEILSNANKKRDYDIQNVDNLKNHQDSKREEFRRKYYGSSSTTYKPSGLNSTRNRVYNATKPPPDYRSIFNGEYRDYSINDVPHFDYEKHLRKNMNVDKRYSESHSFKTNDYVNHYIRTSQDIGGKNNNRRYHKDKSRLENDNTSSGSKAPMLLTFITALSLVMIISKG